MLDDARRAQECEGDVFGIGINIHHASALSQGCLINRTFRENILIDYFFIRALGNGNGSQLTLYSRARNRNCFFFHLRVQNNKGREDKGKQ